MKQQGIHELLGIALGCIGLSYDDFCKLGYDEFAAVYNAYASRRDADFKDEWQRMRLAATLVIQPHLKQKITPERLLPFPWEVQQKRANNGPRMTPDEQRRRMMEVVQRIEKNGKKQHDQRHAETE